MSVTDHRRLRVVAGARSLTIALAGCSGLGRTAVGTISYGSANERLVMVSNPLVSGCHSLGPAGATTVTNNTLVDIIQYQAGTAPGTSRRDPLTETSATTSRRRTAAASYSTVH